MKQMAVLAICTDASVFLNNNILDKNISKKYPGSMWVYEFIQISSIYGIQTITGDIALEELKKGALNIKKIWVMQEENSKIGCNLISLGANLLAVTCAESPLYSIKFYKNINNFTKLFPNKILFRGALSETSDGSGNHIMYFPSFSMKDKTTLIPWGKRKEFVMVASNKYWKRRLPLLKKFILYVYGKIKRRQDEITKEMISLQLLDRRLEIIEYFGKKNLLHLYGRGWNDLTVLPKLWENKLKKILQDMSPTECDNKIEVISSYKYSFCIENYQFPGYVTEKIIDSLAAGVIPVYLGAQDINEFIPTNCFINIRNFNNLHELEKKLNCIGELEAEKILKNGREFIKNKGAVYSYEYFAELILNLLLKELKNAKRNNNSYSLIK